LRIVDFTTARIAGGVVVAERVGSTRNSGMSIRSWSFWSEEKKILAVYQ